MDYATIGGLILGVSAVLVGFFLEGGHLASMIQLPAMLLVLGGTLGASMITTSFRTIANIPRLLRIAIFGRTPDPTQTSRLPDGRGRVAPTDDESACRR